MKRLRSSACYVPQAAKVAWIVHLASSPSIGSCGRFYLFSSASLLAVFPSWFFSPTSTRTSRFVLDFSQILSFRFAISQLVTKLVQIGLNLFKLVKTCPNWPKHVLVPTYLKLSKLIQIWLNLHKLVCTCLNLSKLVQMHHHWLSSRRCSFHTPTSTRRPRSVQSAV